MILCATEVFLLFYQGFSAFWNRNKKELLISMMNPEWKEIVNECGFVRDSSLRSEQALRRAQLLSPH